MKKILVVDDDINICELIGLYLRKEGYEIVFAHDGKSAIDVLAKERPNLVILDIMLPEMDGWDVCTEMKKISDIPIIMLSAKGDTFDKVLGLKLGADDYMVKPFEPRELIARIDAVLRRTYGSTVSTKSISLPDLYIDLDKYIVRIDDEDMKLPKKEMELLYFLVKNKGKVFTREQLIDNIWGIDFFGDTRTIDVHIKRLREKLSNLSDKYNIKTIWGVGYKFEII
ncbi:response regulator transcription factor [Anaeromicrobium sediminis]|uniref:Stage 0 sporulation protein A homolog n=1 Tax=Anaeromicrobium sediminis TaxID=1478221 RepID=A0A267MKL1_9FIRM|nr:response regulator transcription factor [Anaeromicrobium sediminis]PAB59957.1 DNA-binding response regulator [Anaeromicrobium sediminis]